MSFIISRDLLFPSIGMQLDKWKIVSKVIVAVVGAEWWWHKKGNIFNKSKRKTQNLGSKIVLKNLKTQNKIEVKKQEPRHL
jgi:hypothetical protein